MTGTEKEALRRAGVTTVQALATLKDFAPRRRRDPANSSRHRAGRPRSSSWPPPGRSAPGSTNWSTGPGASAAPSARTAPQALGYIPGKGNSTLPVSTPDLNPNLVRVYVDAQHDYLEDRVYLLGALVVACKDGDAGRQAGRRPHDGRPARTRRRRSGTCSWTGPVTCVQAVVDLAVARDAGRREEVGPDPRRLLRPPRAAAAAGGPGPQLPADPRGHAAAVRLPHPARRLRLARSPASSTRRSGRSRTSR